ncbi:glycoside hydrolase 5 family protein [Crateriforma spongiae]|uniref:beta-agarase n=1 Tax=Crateriforma spongiae TaxID=2724528 RepID=UPI001445A22E|nr:beta-agarase [Crateriforma spongiae]
MKNVLPFLLATFLCVPCFAQRATGYIHVEQIDGVWWFVNAEGEKFVSIGVNHIEPHLWLAPYNKSATLRKYGADMVDADGHFNTHGDAAKKWINAQVEVSQSLGFNTFGKHTHPAIDPRLYQQQIYYIASLDTAPLAGWQQRLGRGPRPDVFSADFRAFVERRVEQVTTLHQDQRNLIGYLYTDVPSWVMGRAEQAEKNDTTMIYPWINAILPLGESSPGKRKWLEHLASRYPDAEAAAKAWGMPISPTYGISWDELARQVDWTHPNDVASAKKDMASFMPIIAKQWYAMHEEIIRRHDPNHLILGDKNMVMWHHDFVLPAIREHVDVVCVQAYGPWERDKQLTDMIYQATGKPIFNGDGCFGYAGSNQQLWGVKGFRTGATSVEEVASLYEDMLRGMMSTPYYVGWHHCGYLEQWDAAERGDSPRNENGFLDPFEQPHKQWTEVLQQVNHQAAKLHESAR